mgnify:CR=1 FL=1
MRRLRTVFMGTPDFAVPCLARLAKISDVAGVVTQPDKPRGRGQKLSPSPVKAFAEAHGLTVYQPKRVREEAFISELEKIAPELIVVVAFGQILPQRILDIPPLGCVNVHASLLPRYRGAAPMQRCLMAGERKTGVTTMLMDAGLDTGDMLFWEETTVGADMTMAELHDTLSGMGAELLERTIAALADGTATRTKQDDAASCYAAMLDKETGKMEWSKPALELHNLVRALDSWPGAYATLDGKTYKIWRTRVLSELQGGAPGEIIECTKKGFAVATGRGALEILELQAPGKKRMTAAEYLRGHAFPAHSSFS